MPNFSTSPQMNLIIPTVGQDPGPDWANNINNSLTIIDGHNHSAGYGVPIGVSGLNIQSDLTLNNNNLVDIRSLRFTPQSNPLALVADIGCLYESGVDLYYNDGNGNQVRITSGGGVAGTPGSISNLTTPASASYVAVNQTFVWQSAANTPANMDAASFILRNLTANSFGLTLNPPAAMGANYALTLPTLPAVQSFMTLDASGNMSAPFANIGYQQLGPLNSQLSSSSGTFSTASTTPVDVTNLTVTITTSGRPVYIATIADGSLSGDGAEYVISGTPTPQAGNVFLLSGATVIAKHGLGSSGSSLGIPASSVVHVDFPSAGTYTYKIQVQVLGNYTIAANYMKLIAYEIG